MNNVVLILTLSILIQFAAVFMALRLVWVTKKTLAWVIIASAVGLMALRRSITLFSYLFYESATPLDLTTELIALAISVLMAIGIARIAPFFYSIKNSEEALRRQLVQTCMDGIIANDLQGNIFIFNETATKMLGYTVSEVVGRINVRELYPPGLAQEIKRKISDSTMGKAGILENYETVARHKDGTLIPIWLSARIIYENGREVGVVGHFRDLRERKRLEAELLRNERLSALGRMAAHISHEIKNPLMLIGGFARQVLRNLPGKAQENEEKLKIIIDEVKQLEGFLAELGGYAKIAEPQKSPGDLNALIQETCDRLQPTIQERNITLRLELDQNLPLIHFDAVHLRQVILNVAKNGIEAMPEGGTLTIASGREAEKIFVKISDTGEGIPPEIMERIFEPFFSTKPKGSGLGLAISRKIMEAHQGTITIESEPHLGTRVTCAFELEA